MKNDIILSYRSLQKPKPMWPEVGLYGGYEYIEIAEGVWYPRYLEYLMRYYIDGTTEELRELARKELLNSEKVFRPSALQQDDHLKLRLLLKKVQTVAIQGYSLAAEEFLSQLIYTTIYTDADYNLPNIRKITTEKLCQLSVCTITLVNCKSLNLKQSIANWGNIIVYDSNLFYESDLMLCIGGNNEITVNTTTKTAGIID